MIAMTTNSSINVNPRCDERFGMLLSPFEQITNQKEKRLKRHLALFGIKKLNVFWPSLSTSTLTIDFELKSSGICSVAS